MIIYVRLWYIRIYCSIIRGTRYPIRRMDKPYPRNPRSGRHSQAAARPLLSLLWLLSLLLLLLTIMIAMITYYYDYYHHYYYYCYYVFIIIIISSSSSSSSSGQQQLTWCRGRSRSPWLRTFLRSPASRQGNM